MRTNTVPEPALLGFLLAEPMHGYDLYKQVNRHLGLVWSVGLSQMYAIVKTFETRGWIRTERRVQATRPSQKILELTPDGRSAFDEWLGRPAHGMREFRVDFFLRLYFARRAGVSAARALVNGQLAALRRELENLQARRRDAEEQANDLDQLARDFRIQQLTTMIEWLESHRSQLVQAGGDSTTVLPGASSARRTRVRRSPSSIPSKEKKQ